MNLTPIAGVILAGGRSRRMNVPSKAFLDIAGKPLLQHVIDRLRPQVSYLELSVERVSGEYEAFGLVQVPDPMPGNCSRSARVALLRRTVSPGLYSLLSVTSSNFAKR